MMARAVFVWLSVCLVGGAAVSVAVAWAVSAGDHWTNSPGKSSTLGGRLIRRDVTFYAWGARREGSEVWDTREFVELPRTPDAPSSPTVDAPRWVEAHPGRAIVTRGYGWPFVCMKGIEPEFAPSLGGPATRPARGWLVLKETQWKAPLVRVPLLPVVSGLAINATMFAAPVLLFVLAVRAVVRNRRRVLGRCVGCGYLRDGLGPMAACPECGRIAEAEPGPQGASERSGLA